MSASGRKQKGSFPRSGEADLLRLTDPDDMEGQLVDEDNQIAEMAARTAKAIARGKTIFVPIVVRAIREACGLSQREAGEVFGTGAKSFEKYESSEITPSKPTERLLRLAMERPSLFRKPAPGKFPFPSAAEPELIRRTLRDASMDRIYAPLLAAAERKRAASPAPGRSPPVIQLMGGPARRRRAGRS